MKYVSIIDWTISYQKHFFEDSPAENKTYIHLAFGNERRS
jgi:hypothetical protein